MNKFIRVYFSEIPYSYFPKNLKFNYYAIIIMRNIKKIFFTSKN